MVCGWDIVNRKEWVSEEHSIEFASTIFGCHDFEFLLLSEKVWRSKPSCCHFRLSLFLAFESTVTAHHPPFSYPLLAFKSMHILQDKKWGNDEWLDPHPFPHTLWNPLLTPFSIDWHSDRPRVDSFFPLVFKYSPSLSLLTFQRVHVTPFFLAIKPTSCCADAKY